MNKVYTVSDLFFTSWAELSPKQQAQVYALKFVVDSYKNHPSEDPDINYGMATIALLRILRKRPLLVDKIDVEQAVDIYNDLAFLNEPWYHFIDLHLPFSGMRKPDEKMARSTFDHFIYADHEYSCYLITLDDKYKKQLLCALYQEKIDPNRTDELAEKLKAEPWELDHVFFAYAQCRQFIMNRCKTLLPPAAASEGEEKRPTGDMWQQLKFRLAETPAFQGMETAGRANMYTALDYLEDLAKQNTKKHA